MASERWLLARKSKNSWNEDVYDTAYALGALADMETQDRDGCKWLYEHYCPAWEQVGTTSLIIMALKKQENLAKSKDFETFIREKAEWILSKKGQDGGWEHISTSNLAIQALLLAGFKKEIEDSVHWLLENVHKNGAWGNKEDDINATALALSTLGLYNRNLNREKIFLSILFPSFFQYSYFVYFFYFLKQLFRYDLPKNINKNSIFFRILPINIYIKQYYFILLIKITIQETKHFVQSILPRRKPDHVDRMDSKSVQPG